MNRNIQHIYLVWHGQSRSNVDQAVYGTTPNNAIGLSELGESQAAAAGAALRNLIDTPAGEPLCIWTSPYQWTRKTAELLAAELRRKISHLDLFEHINLHEQQFGLFDGVTEEDFPLRFPDEHAHYELAVRHGEQFWARMPLGESRFDVARRVHEAFGTFHRDAGHDGLPSIIVICHGVTLRAFVMMWRHLEYEWLDRQPNPSNCDFDHIDAGASGDDGRYVYRIPAELGGGAI